MREIKYKAWDKKNKQMSKLFSIGTLAQYEHIFETMFVKLPIWTELIWLEYTGLKDKNGKEIYEGDLVKVSSGSYCLEVVYDPPKFKLRDKYGEWHMNPLATQTHFEIIGNIYESPELLEIK